MLAACGHCNPACVSDRASLQQLPSLQFDLARFCIQVTDNGGGFEAADLRLAGQRYHTSKIDGDNLSDLRLVRARCGHGSGRRRAGRGGAKRYPAWMRRQGRAGTGGIQDRASNAGRAGDRWRSYGEVGTRL